MKRSAGLAIGLSVLYLLHNDFWFWSRSDAALGGLPVGLAYHVAYCLLVSIFWSIVVRRLGSKELQHP